MDKGVWQATYSPWGHKELGMAEWLTLSQKKTHQLYVNSLSLKPLELLDVVVISIVFQSSFIFFLFFLFFL